MIEWVFKILSRNKFSINCKLTLKMSAIKKLNSYYSHEKMSVSTYSVFAMAISVKFKDQYCT